MRQRQAPRVRFAEAGGKGTDSPALDETHKRVDRTSGALSLPPRHCRLVIAAPSLPPLGRIPDANAPRSRRPFLRTAPRSRAIPGFSCHRRCNQTASIGPEQKLPVGPTNLTEGLGAERSMSANQSLTRSSRRRGREELEARQGLAPVPSSG